MRSCARSFMARWFVMGLVCLGAGSTIGCGGNSVEEGEMVKDAPPPPPGQSIEEIYGQQGGGGGQPADAGPEMPGAR